MSISMSLVLASSPHEEAAAAHSYCHDWRAPSAMSSLLKGTKISLKLKAQITHCTRIKGQSVKEAIPATLFLP